MNRELQCFKRAGRPTDSCERYNGRTTGRKNGGREGKEGGRRPSKADEASQRFWEKGQGKPSTSSRGFIFFPLLSHPERVHLSGFTTTEGRHPPAPRSCPIHHSSVPKSRREVPTEQKITVRTVKSDLVQFEGLMVREVVVQLQLENNKDW